MICKILGPVPMCIVLFVVPKWLPASITLARSYKTVFVYIINKKSHTGRRGIFYA